MFECVLLHFSHDASRIERGLVSDLSCGDESVTVVVVVSEVGSALPFHSFVHLDHVFVLPQLN